MAPLTIEVPEEVASLFESAPLEADSVEMRGLIAWNVQARADRLGDWAEGNERSADELRRLVTELDTLATALEVL